MKASKKINREIKLSFRLSIEENLDLNKKIELSSVRKSEFIRLSLQKSVIISKLNTEEKELVRQLAGLANNLNQIARKLNKDNGNSLLIEDTIIIRSEIDQLLKLFKK